MPRPKHIDPPVTWKIQIPESIAAQIELHLYDPFYQKVKYGSRSDLITQLLREWLEKQTLVATQPEPKQ